MLALTKQEIDVALNALNTMLEATNDMHEQDAQRYIAHWYNHPEGRNNEP